MRGDERKTGMKKKKVSKAGNQSYVGALPLLLSFCSFFLKKKKKGSGKRKGTTTCTSTVLRNRRSIDTIALVLKYVQRFI